MSFDFRFEPPSITELEEMAQFETDCDHECDKCFWDCEGDDQ